MGVWGMHMSFVCLYVTWDLSRRQKMLITIILIYWSSLAQVAWCRISQPDTSGGRDTTMTINLTHPAQTSITQTHSDTHTNRHTHTHIHKLKCVFWVVVKKNLTLLSLTNIALNPDMLYTHVHPHTQSHAHTYTHAHAHTHTKTPSPQKASLVTAVPPSNSFTEGEVTGSSPRGG